MTRRDRLWDGLTRSWLPTKRIVFLRGARAERLRAARRAVAADPNSPAALRWLAAVLHDVGRCREARQVVTEALRVAPNDSESHFILGLIAHSERRFRAAEAAYRDALRLDPQNESALNNLGLVLNAKGSHSLRRRRKHRQEALRMFTYAAEENPQAKFSRANLSDFGEREIGRRVDFFFVCCWVWIPGVLVIATADGAAAPRLSAQILIVIAIFLGAWAISRAAAFRWRTRALPLTTRRFLAEQLRNTRWRWSLLLFVNVAPVLGIWIARWADDSSANRPSGASWPLFALLLVLVAGSAGSVIRGVRRTGLRLS